MALRSHPPRRTPGPGPRDHRRGPHREPRAEPPRRPPPDHRRRTLGSQPAHAGLDPPPPAHPPPLPLRSRHGGQLAPGTPHHRPLNAPHLGDEAACPGTPAGPGWARKGSGDDHEGGDHAADITASRETSPGVRPGAGTARGAPEGREAEARCDEPGDGKRRSGATSPEARGREPVTLGRSLRPGAGSRKPGSRRPGIPDRSRERKPGQPGQGQTTGARAGRVGGDLSGAGRGPGWMAGRTGAEPESRTWN